MSEDEHPHAKIYRLDREASDEMMTLAKRTLVNLEPSQEGKPRQQETCNFGDFSVITVRTLFKGPTESITLTNNKTAASVDLISDVPPDHQLTQSHYPFAKYNPQTKRIDYSTLATKSRLFAFIHEVDHATDPETITQQEARVAFNKGVATPQQRQLIINQEQQDWLRIKQKIRRYEQQLGVTIIENETSYDTFVRRRIDSYLEKPLTSPTQI